MAHPMPDDPEVVAFIEQTNAFYPADAFRFTVEENRAWYDKYCAAFRSPRPEGVKVEDFFIPAKDGHSVRARRYRPENADRVKVLYLHGGGFVVGGLDSHDDVCAELAARTGLEVVSADYRLAPENLHPAQIDDAETAFLYLSADGNPVIVGGDSAGANLTAALTLRRRDKGGAQPVGQFMIYPGLGGDINKGSYVQNAEAPMLRRDESIYYIKVRVGPDHEGISDPEIMPLQARSLAGLPPAFIVSADIDPLRDDAREYFERLQAEGVNAEYRNEPQLVHGYLRARHMSRRAAESFTAICSAVEKMARDHERVPQTT